MERPEDLSEHDRSPLAIELQQLIEARRAEALLAAALSVPKDWDSRMIMNRARIFERFIITGRVQDDFEDYTRN